MKKRIKGILRILLIFAVVFYVSLALGKQNYAASLEEEKKKIIIVALVDTLEYLKKGGRVSKTVAFAGTLLHIKQVLTVT